MQIITCICKHVLKITYSAYIKIKYKIKQTNHLKVLQKQSSNCLPCLNMKYLVPFKFKDITIIYSQIKNTGTVHL